MQYELGFIGSGNMAQAIAQAAIRADLLMPDQMISSDPSPERRDVFHDLGIATSPDNAEVIAGSKQIMLAIKPQMASTVLASLGEALTDEQVILSIMAGLSTRKINALLQGDSPGEQRQFRIIRIMPNTPVMVSHGMAGIALGQFARTGDETLALRLFEAAGKALIVDENDLDTITAVSGSGPAYVFYLAEAMEEAARQLGLSAHARQLARQTILGGAMLLDESPDTAGELRRKVTSPGGTTEAAINHMQSNKTLDVIVTAIKAAHDRSVELGK